MSSLGRWTSTRSIRGTWRRQIDYDMVPHMSPTYYWFSFNRKWSFRRGSLGNVSLLTLPSKASRLHHDAISRQNDVLPDRSFIFSHKSDRKLRKHRTGRDISAVWPLNPPYQNTYIFSLRLHQRFYIQQPFYYHHWALPKHSGFYHLYHFINFGNDVETEKSVCAYSRSKIEPILRNVFTMWHFKWPLKWAATLFQPIKRSEVRDGCNQRFFETNFISNTMEFATWARYSLWSRSYTDCSENNSIGRKQGASFICQLILIHEEWFIYYPRSA